MTKNVRQCKVLRDGEVVVADLFALNICGFTAYIDENQANIYYVKYSLRIKILVKQ